MPIQRSSPAAKRGCRPATSTQNNKMEERKQISDHQHNRRRNQRFQTNKQFSQNSPPPSFKHRLSLDAEGGKMLHISTKNDMLIS